MVLAVARSVIETLLAETARAAPNECCGLLFGTESRIETALPARNVHPSPSTHFEIDAVALIAAHKAEREGGPQVVGYYHSHPAGPAEPSVTDAAQAACDGRVWAIVAGHQIALWRDSPGGFEPLSTRVVDG
jgi:proteasome lid subunit RPN8/RPN11